MKYSIVIVEKNYREVYVEADTEEDAWEKFDKQNPDELFSDGIELQTEYEYAESTLGPAGE